VDLVDEEWNPKNKLVLEESFEDGRDDETSSFRLGFVTLFDVDRGTLASKAPTLVIQQTNIMLRRKMDVTWRCRISRISDML
jgi:hypothetical protein